MFISVFVCTRTRHKIDTVETSWPALESGDLKHCLRQEQFTHLCESACLSVCTPPLDRAESRDKIPVNDSEKI